MPICSFFLSFFLSLFLSFSLSLFLSFSLSLFFSSLVRLLRQKRQTNNKIVNSFSQPTSERGLNYIRLLFKVCLEEERREEEESRKKKDKKKKNNNKRRRDEAVSLSLHRSVGEISLSSLTDVSFSLSQQIGTGANDHLRKMILQWQAENQRKKKKERKEEGARGKNRKKTE